MGLLIKTVLVQHSVYAQLGNEAAARLCVGASGLNLDCHHCPERAEVFAFSSYS